MNPKPNRRDFLRRTAQVSAAIGAPMFVPASALGRGGATPPSERIQMGAIGIGNRGTSDLENFLANTNTHFRAVCDVKLQRRVQSKQLVDQANGNSDCAMYTDLRHLLDRSDLDAVMIATGPNWHAVGSTLAARAGKDVYCEKPCTKNISQSLELAETFRRTGRMFQAGTQRRSIPNFVYACQLARSGRLGKLHTVYAHPAGMAAEMSGWLQPQTEPDLKTVDWDLYLGPAAWRPFNALNLDGFNFEKGGGLVGGGVLEWGSHCVDLCQWANNADDTPAIKYARCENNQLVAEYPNGVKLVLREEGWIPLGSCPVRFEGDRGWVETGDSGRIVYSSPELRSESQVEVGGYPITHHVVNFVNSVKTRTPAICNADVACNSHLTCHAANIALFLNRALTFDPTTHQFVKDAEANRLLSEAQRGPWSI